MQRHKEHSIMSRRISFIRNTTAIKISFASFLTICFFNLTSYAQEVKVIGVEQLEDMMTHDSKSLKVFNFWASWCGPCVKELPYFNEINEMSGVEVFLISLDFPEDLEKAKNLLTKKQIHAQAFLLQGKNYIEKVDNRWSGAIPATIFIESSGARQFHEGSFTLQELKNLVVNIHSK